MFLYSFKHKPLHLILLPVFFVFHGFTENYDFVPLKDGLLLVLIYIGSAIILTSFFWLFYRSVTKSALMASLIMAYHFFFGSIQDVLRKYFPETFFSRYTFILLVSFFLLLAVFIWLKRIKNPIVKLPVYLNLLFVLLILIDVASLIGKLNSTKRPPVDLAGTGLIKCDSCKKPDIYFIVLDEYSGNTALQERFNFNNSDFENKLSDRGFYIVQNSRSNYNYTPFSIASLLNMGYLDLDMKSMGQGNLPYCYRMIRDSRVLQFLNASDYDFYNYSVFDFHGQPAVNSDRFLPSKTRLITSQTFLNRIWNDILFNVSTGKLRFKSIEKKVIYSHLHNNENFIRLTSDIAARESVSPKFVYTHLMMPHYPYYFDSKSQPLPFDSLVEEKRQSRENYVEYLKYCNTRILQLADDILKVSPSPPVIVLAGDHGFRYFKNREDRKYCFMTLAAVYLPSANYSRFYRDMSGVNLFPVILNSQFQQQIPLQKDSTIYLWD